MARLDLSFLGTFHATLDGRPLTHFRANNNKGLLIYLALNGERPVAREVLATLFWPDESGDTANNNLRQALYQLRQLLGDTTNDIPILTATRQSVQFNCGSDHTLDVTRFLRAIEAHDLDAAVAHYAGELLPGFTCDSLEFEAWLRLERERLHQLALEALFEAAQDHLAAGRLDKAQAHARRQLALEPWREPAYRQLMQAYALAGDRAGAFAQYEAGRAALWAELGVEPAPETVALREAIAAGRYGPVAAGETIRPPQPRRHNLPAALTPFLGREIELAAIGRLLTHDGQRLVTIVGPGGMGKTRLALAVGAALLEQYEDGVYFVDLAPVERAEDILPAIAVALNYQTPDKSLDLKSQLLTALCRRHLLLILDNFEQVLAGAALVNELLESCARLSVLATSRERLHLAGESRYELSGLDYPEAMTPETALSFTAVRLFVENGRRARPDFALTAGTVADVARICRQVQGMPLALVLAAAWLDLLAPAEIAAEIERGAEFLAVDLADLPARQRSLRAVFERSWGMMTPDEQAVMAGLSVFRGGFTREAAEEVAGANLRVLLALVNKSLLQRRPDSGRFAVHELLRQYAAARRRRDDLGRQVELAHCRHFARAVKTELKRLRDIAPVQLPERLAGDGDNLQRAWNYAIAEGLVEEAADLAGGLYALANAQGVQTERFYEEALPALAQRGIAETHPAMLRLRLLALVGLSGLYEPSHVRRLYLEFVPIAEAHADPTTLLQLYLPIAAFYCTGRNPEALVWAEKAVRLAPATGDAMLQFDAEIYEVITRTILGLGDDAALLRLQTAAAEAERSPTLTRWAFEVVQALRDELLNRGDLERALHYGAQLTNMAKSARNLHGIGSGAYGLAEAARLLGQPAVAARHLLDGLEWHLAIGKRWQTLGYLYSMNQTFPTLFGGETAIAVLSMVYHHPEAIALYRAEIAHTRPRFEVELDPVTFAAAWERGKTMDFDTAIAQARAALLEPIKTGSI